MQEHQLGQIVIPLLDWYHANKRKLPWRQDNDPYRIWISEIMLQQTRVEAVLPYYERFMERCPTVSSLAACDDEELFKLWEGLGYYSRARNLKKAAQIICSQYHGQFPMQFEDILTLPGIGVYTAGAVSSIAFGQARAAVDGNVLRVITRLTENSQDITDAGFRRHITEELEKIYPAQERGDFTQSLMELGAVVCLPNGTPKCEQCPLNSLCGAFQRGTQMLYPVKRPKKARKLEEITVLLLCCKENFLEESQEQIAVRKREQKGVLSGLWELPNLEGFFTEKQILGRLEEMGPALGLCNFRVSRKTNTRHIFTHVEWQMECMMIECEADRHESKPDKCEPDKCTADERNDNNASLIWVTRKQLKTEIALPTAFKKVCGLFGFS